MNLREAAEKALEALDYYRSTDPNWHVSDETTYQELKTALAEAEEPVAWAGYNLDQMAEAFDRVIDAIRGQIDPLDMHAEMALRDFRKLIPAMQAYKRPPRREPLTEEQIRRLYRGAWTPESEADEVLAFARAIERAHGVGGDE